jgi:arylsulfatase
VPFRFTGTIDQVTIELKDMKKADRDEAERVRREKALKKGLSD